MNARGQYSNGHINGQRGRVHVGARLVHTLELKQRYDNAKTGAVQSLLNVLSREGTVTPVGTHRWEIALKDGAWIVLVWYPDWNALEVTVTDRELRAVDQMDRIRRSYETILAKITPQLQRFGVTTVGAATYAGQQLQQQQPRFAARTRAIKAVFDMYTTSHRGAPYYIYAEVNGMIDRRSAPTLDEANAIFFSLEKSPGEVYVAIFDPTDPLWPGPAADVYHAAPQVPQAPQQDRPTVVGQANAQSRALIQSAMRQAVDSHARVLQNSRTRAVQPPAFYVWKLVAAQEEEGGSPSYANMNFVSTRDEALDYVRRLNQVPVVVATAVFDPTSRHWPNPIAWHQSQTPGHQWAIDRHLSGEPLVGITIYHSVGDRAEAVKQMAIDWTALYQNLASQAGELIRDPKSSSGYRLMTQVELDANPPDPKKAAWWKSYASPLIQQWAAFKREQLGDRTFASDYIAFAERWQTNWNVYEDWKKKLDNLRAEAVKQGFSVEAPKPMDLPTTVWADVGDVVQRGAGKVASGLGDVWNLVKYGAWAVLGIGAIVAISSVASNLRSGKDPAEKYVGMIREGRRPRAPRALPERREQLALPPGDT